LRTPFFVRRKVSHSARSVVESSSSSQIEEQDHAREPEGTLRSSPRRLEWSLIILSPDRFDRAVRQSLSLALSQFARHLVNKIEVGT